MAAVADEVPSDFNAAVADVWKNHSIKPEWYQLNPNNLVGRVLPDDIAAKLGTPVGLVRQIEQRPDGTVWAFIEPVVEDE